MHTGMPEDSTEASIGEVSVQVFGSLVETLLDVISTLFVVVEVSNRPSIVGLVQTV